MPAKITFEGGNTCNHTYQRVNLEWLKVPQFTVPIPLLTVAENADRTFMVGSSHFVNFSSTPVD